MNEKGKETIPEKEKEVNMSVKVPESVHRKLNLYRSRIAIQRNTDYNIDEAYSEALKEFTAKMTL